MRSAGCGIEFDGKIAVDCAELVRVGNCFFEATDGAVTSVAGLAAVNNRTSRD